MISLYERKCKNMSDAELADECVHHGKIMEMRAVHNLLLTPEQKSRAITCFEEAVSRDSMSDEKEMLELALKVVRNIL